MGLSSISRSLTEGLTREGRKILGGDMAFSLVHREATEAERAFLGAHGAGLLDRGHARHGDRRRQGLGARRAEGGRRRLSDRRRARDRAASAPRRELLAERDGAFGGAVDPASLPASTSSSATASPSAPRRSSSGRASSPSPTRSRTASASARASSSRRRRCGPPGSLQPGSLVRWTYRLAPAAGAARRRRLWSAIADDAGRAFPEAGWEIRSRVNADPRFARNIERFTQFLTLVGLTALLVGGVGVANAVRGFVDRKRDSIATLKSLGAPGGQVVALYLVAGDPDRGGRHRHRARASARRCPSLVAGLFGASAADPDRADARPGRARASRCSTALLTALAFALAPLGRAHDVPVSGLFRDQVDPERRWPRRRYLAALALSVAALAALARPRRLRPAHRADLRRRGRRRLRAPARRRGRHHGARRAACRGRAGPRRASRSPTSTGPAR